MKQLLSLLLVAAMLLATPAFPLPAAAEAQLCSCGCGQEADKIQWKPWTFNVDGAPSDGHYYLEDNYAQSKQCTIMAGDRVVLDLRGKTLTTQTYNRLFLVYGYLAVLDSVGGGRMCAKTSGAGYGGVVMVALNETYDSTFAFHGGMLTVDSDNKSSLAGGLVVVAGGCHFIMYDGTLLGGSTTQHGGAVRGSSATSDIQILGGSIIGCKAEEAGGAIHSVGNVTLKNCLLSGNEASGTAKGSGGNVYMDGGSLTIENATIESGVSNATENGGGNIYTKGNCRVTIKNSTICNGYAAKNGGNLYLGKGTQQLENVSVFGGVAGGNGANLYKTSEASLTTANCQITPEIGSTCPHCKQTVTWTNATETLSGHCYLTEAKNITAAYVITGDVVLDLRGKNIISTERAFKIESGASLTIIDSVGGATVKGSGVASAAGGVIHNAGTLNIYGGNYIYTAGKKITSGGVIYTDGNVTLQGGVLDGRAFSNTASTALGGALHMSAGSRTLTMTAGRVLGGSAYEGGSFYFSESNVVTITGGSFSGGTASNAGGNIRFNGTYAGRINATINNVYLNNGTTGTNGFAGNISANYVNLSIDNCVVLNGSAGTYGGNIALGTRGQLTAQNSFIANGTAPKGGNVYTASYVSGADFTDCTVVRGQASTQSGGNMMVNQGNVNFTGGMLAYGTAKQNGGNVYTNGGNYNHNDAKDDGFRLFASQKGLPIVTTGTAASGGNIYSTGVTVLDAAFINNGSATTGKDIYYGPGAAAYSLTVGAGLTGNISMYAADAAFTGSEVVNASAVEFPGKLFLEGTTGNETLTVYGGKLVLGSIAVVAADGSIQWVADMATAQAACAKDSYIKIFADSTMVLTKDCAVDLNGKTLTVSGGYTLYGMDSSGDDYTIGTGKAILSGNAKTAIRTTLADGRDYIAIADGSNVTYHRLGMQLTDVTLRTSSCGVYYKASWECDSQLAALVDSYGIALSVYKTPDENFQTDEQVKSIAYDGSELTNGEKKSGVVISNIMKDSLPQTSNKKRGQMPIYASAYLQLHDGTKLMSQEAAHSLKTAMEQLDGLITSDPTYFRRYTNTARAFYETWKENGMNDWNFTNIPTPKEDDVIDVLMIGNSFCYYYVEELYGLAAAAGIKMRVCNVYYSGCRLDQHYNWWKNDEAMYQFFVTDGNGRQQYNNVSLEYCLAQGNWDVISLQTASTSVRTDGGAQAHLEKTALYTDALIPYLQNEFPKAAFVWHQPWAYQIGYNRNGYAMTSLEQQDRDTAYMRDYTLLVCEKYGISRINTGEAWQIVRYGGYDNLCARLASNNGEGDYYHDGDIGGGQYLNACVWFEHLTGQSCVGNTYAPVYTHSGKTYTLDADMIAMLQNAAHEAVSAMQDS